MDTIDRGVVRLRHQILQCEERLAELKDQLYEAERLQQSEISSQNAGGQSSSSTSASGPRRWPLEAAEYRRYGRQLVMPEIGLKGK